VQSIEILIAIRLIQAHAENGIGPGARPIRSEIKPVDKETRARHNYGYKYDDELTPAPAKSITINWMNVRHD
jgi:hypothetical protein